MKAATSNFEYRAKREQIIDLRTGSTQPGWRVTYRRLKSRRWSRILLAQEDLPAMDGLEAMLLTHEAQSG